MELLETEKSMRSNTSELSGDRLEREVQILKRQLKQESQLKQEALRKLEASRFGSGDSDDDDDRTAFYSFASRATTAKSMRFSSNVERVDCIRTSVGTTSARILYTSIFGLYRQQITL